MFENVGRKLQKLVKISFIITSVLFILLILLAIAINANDDETFSIVCGSLLFIFISWVNACIIYGFGKIVEYIEQMAQKPNHSDSKADKIETLIRIKEEGLITEKEYLMMKNRLASPEEMLRMVKKKYDTGEMTEQQYTEAKIKILSRL